MSTTTTPEMEVLGPEPTARPAQGRGWALAGLGAGLAGIATIVGSSMTTAVYDTDVAGDAAGIMERLAEQTGPLLLMHTGAMVSAVLLVVFGAGLRRRLAESGPDGSLLPQVALSALLLVSVALLMGSGLTTEFAFGVKDENLLVPATAAFFGHWVNTIPWLWVGAGVAALAVGLAGRSSGAVAPWLAWTSLLLGTITTLFGMSPLQYMAGVTGPLWLTIASVGLLSATRARG
ncbi:MAG TPA: hypothetical protein VFL69_13350 [Marmoricola sp.]|nr:hypothetical protein [Marmoricola sp.]